MKKLVKTAKQQFEERLRELTLIKKYAMTETDLYYLCENSANDMCILREIHGTEFYEQRYNCSYLNLISGEEFLRAITFRFIDHYEIDVKPLFDWYASADKDDEPFTLDDIWMCNLEDEDHSVVYHDIYEEVPDVRVITAKEQWENDSKDAKELWSTGVETLKVCLTDDYVKFYRLDDAITCYTYPSLEMMRKDRWFVCHIVDTLSESCEHDKISPFIKWTRDGGDFPLPISIIFNSDYQEYTCHVYEDKELPQEQTIEEMIALTPKQQEEVKKFEAALKSLKDSGVKIISYWDENEFFAVNGNCNLDFDCSYRSLDEKYADISTVLVKKHIFPFSWDLYWGVDTSFCAKRI